MTIYLIKWITDDENIPHQYACSSYTSAQNKIRELIKNPKVRILPCAEGPIDVVKPKTQADVINLINSM